MKKILSLMLTFGLITSTMVVRAAAEEITPETQALKIYKVIRDQDYKAMFYLMAFTPKGRATLTSAEQFAMDMQKGYDSSFKTKEEKAECDRMLRSISEIMIGEPVIAGDKAVIPVSAKITANGKTMLFKGQAHLIKEAGVWKLDLTIDDDAEKATAQRVSELFGQPSPVP